MHDSDLWAIEEEFWTAGEAFFKQGLDAGAMMVLPSYGVLSRDAVIDIVRLRPCSRRATLKDRLSFSPSQDVAVLAYTVHALKRDGNRHNGRCKSTYLRIEGRWLLVMHNQTHIEEPFGEDDDLLNSPVTSVAARVFGPFAGRRAEAVAQGHVASRRAPAAPSGLVRRDFASWPH